MKLGGGRVRVYSWSLEVSVEGKCVKKMMLINGGSGRGRV